jgi:hypothetical protein
MPDVFDIAGSKRVANWCPNRPENPRHACLPAPRHAETRQPPRCRRCFSIPRRRISRSLPPPPLPGTILIDTARPEVQHAYR